MFRGRRLQKQQRQLHYLLAKPCVRLETLSAFYTLLVQPPLLLYNNTASLAAPHTGGGTRPRTGNSPQHDARQKLLIIYGACVAAVKQRIHMQQGDLQFLRIVW